MKGSGTPPSDGVGKRILVWFTDLHTRLSLKLLLVVQEVPVTMLGDELVHLRPFELHLDCKLGSVRSE